jgi:hypothetical protein
MPNCISEVLKSFIGSENKEHHRFNSWRHCYNHFQDEYFEGNSSNELAALNLGFYLASWGMYRGSTFLLQNDYTIHIGIVEILKANKDLDFSNFVNIQKVEDELKRHYKKANDSTLESNEATHTLVTKILLGTYACTPAYDDFFKKGLGLQHKLPNKHKLVKTFGENSLNTLNHFYEANQKEFVAFEDEYPKMKLLDMYFWKIGLHYAKFLKNNKDKTIKNDTEKVWELVCQDITSECKKRQTL